jgi:hypothetical protein
MDAEKARTIAQRLHAGHRDEAGSPCLQHIGRVAGMTPAEARAVAWLHEAFESTAVSEQELLPQRLASDELRALRLLARTADSRSDRVYLAHVDLIARVRPGRWSPPYARALARLRYAAGVPVPSASIERVALG